MEENDDLRKQMIGVGSSSVASTDAARGERETDPSIHTPGLLSTPLSRARLLGTGVRAGLATYIGVQMLANAGFVAAAAPPPPKPTPATGTAADLHHKPLRFLNAAQAKTIGAMAERIFPADHNGPGATDARVVDYIDGQLADGWGRGDKWYLQGPFFVPQTSGHGWQASMTPRDAYTHALVAIDAYAATQHGSPFDQLHAAAQDQILTALSNGKVPMALPSDLFFGLFRENVLEGLFADPLYGGNRNMVGWKWVRFPGDPMAYGDLYGYYIDKFNVPYNVAPRSLADQPY